MITLIEDTHKYLVDGKPVSRSVTEILDIDKTWLTEQGRLRGKLTHLALKYFNDGVLDEAALDPQLEPYFRAYVRWLADSGFIVVDSELKVYNKAWDYAGTIDILGRFPRSPLILNIGDTKTGQMQDWTRLQTALYSMALNRYVRRFGLELRQNGTYKYKEYTNAVDYLEAAVMLKKLKEA